MERYAIEIIGYKTRTTYHIKQIVNGLVIPYDRKHYKTEQEAREAADKLGIQISKVGTYYEII